MKKLFGILSMLVFFISCGNSASNGENNNLVIYSPNSEQIIQNIIPAFEEKTGIKVELISAGTGELVKRIESEKENPYGDILFGGSKATMLSKPELFEEYVSINNDAMLEGHKNVAGFITPYTADGSVILVNTDLIGDIEINGYADLLNPALKGKIVSADASNSSSAFAQLTNQLLAMGGDYTSEKGWNYVKALLENIDGKILNSSSAVHKGVADGEYAVGLTYEDPSATYLKNGAPVKIVYPIEGTVFLDAGVEIIKGAKNLENAKKFIDFVTSQEAQSIFGEELTNRPIRSDAKTGSHMKPISEIKTLIEDTEYVKEHKKEIIEKYKNIVIEIKK